MKKSFLYTAQHDFVPEADTALPGAVAALTKLYERGVGEYVIPESSLFLPTDEQILKDVEQLAKKYVSEKTRFIIVIGIGGSNLGAKAVYDALRGMYDLALPHTPKLLFLDALSANALDAVFAMTADLKSADELLVNIVSKSGNTTESVANFSLLHASLTERFPDIASRIVVTTDKDSALWKTGTNHGFGLLAIPAPVGGRFSVFSAVGLFPLFAAGFDVRAFQEGGKEMLDRVISEDREVNWAMRSAEELFVAMQTGSSMLNLFYFHPELESLGKWERQLVAESLGKEKDRSGEVIHTGITPIVSIASADLHSMAQLYFGGPRDKFTMLIHAHEGKSVTIPKEGPLSGLVSGLSGKSTTDVGDAIFQGVKAAYVANALPSAEVEFSEISAHVLGAYMEWRMATVIYLATLLKVNAFDQPNVEDYKKVTREILSK